jgi:hypothetical protein
MKKLILILAFCSINLLSFGQYIYTVAGGTNTVRADGVQATSTIVDGPSGVAADAAGNFYIVEADGVYLVRKVDPSGIISTFAGTFGTPGSSGDGGSATSAEIYPWGVAADASGNVYIADYGNHKIRKVNSSGIISTFAGNGTAGYSGDGGSATSAKLNSPMGVTVDASGNVYIADGGNNVIRKINTSGIISTIAGNGTAGFAGDGGSATSAKLYSPRSVAIDASGNIYIADYQNYVIRKVNTSGVISTFAGNHIAGETGDGGAATSAKVYLTTGVAVDASGNVYISEGDAIIGNPGGNRIRKVNTSGTISTFAGTGSSGFSGDGGAATSAKINWPQNIAITNNGNLLIADYNNDRVREITINCPANAGPNVNDYKSPGDGTICAGVQIGTNPLISGLTYAWSPTTALSCTNCAQPTCSTTATQTYTLSVSGSGCTTATSTVTVTPLTPTISATISSTSAVPGSNITATATYSSNFTPTYTYWSLTQCTSGGVPIAGGYTTTSGYFGGVASGTTYTFSGTSGWPCDSYYIPWYSTGNSCVGPWVTGSLLHIITSANAGSNQTDVENCHYVWPGMQIGTPSVPNMVYAWSPTVALSCTNCAQPTSTWTNTSSCEIYTISVNYSACPTATSTVQVCAQAYTGAPCDGPAPRAATLDANNQINNFNVFPNPSSNKVTVSLYDNAEYIRVIDLTGKIIFEVKNVNATEFVLDVSKYSRGIYFVLAKIGNKLERQKLLIE